MTPMILALAATALVALPASAQSGATHVDASGAVSGRSPHKLLRPVATAAQCGGTRVHVPAGRLPTYGAPAPDPRCRAMQIADRQEKTTTNQD